MSNPDLAIFLYIAIIAVSLMFSPKWGEFLSAVTQAKGKTSTTTTVSLGGDKIKLENLKDKVDTSAESTGGRHE